MVTKCNICGGTHGDTKTLFDERKIVKAINGIKRTKARTENLRDRMTTEKWNYIQADIQRIQNDIILNLLCENRHLRNDVSELTNK